MPTLNVLSIKESGLEQIILFGEDSLRTSIRHFVDHYHLERNHQGLGNRLIIPMTGKVKTEGRIERRERLGRLLNYFYPAACSSSGRQDCNACGEIWGETTNSDSVLGK